MRSSECDFFQPDIIFIGKDRLGIIGEKRIEGAPDLVVEIPSPSTAVNDLWDKRQVYESSGVRKYRIGGPGKRVVEVYGNVEGRFLPSGRGVERRQVGSTALEGFTIDIEKIF